MSKNNQERVKNERSDHAVWLFLLANNLLLFSSDGTDGHFLVSKVLVSQFLTMFKTFGITTKVFRARKSFLLQYFWSVIKETKIFLLGMQTIACHVKCRNFLVTLLWDVRHDTSTIVRDYYTLLFPSVFCQPAPPPSPTDTHRENIITQLNTRIYWNKSLAAPDVFHMLTQSIKFYTFQCQILTRIDAWKRWFIKFELKKFSCFLS